MELRVVVAGGQAAFLKLQPVLSLAGTGLRPYLAPKARRPGTAGLTGTAKAGFSGIGAPARMAAVRLGV